MEIIRMVGISKQYPGVKALDNADFSLRENEIHSLLGENGAGKSTLMKILYGLEKPTEGYIEFKGKKVSIKTTHDAIDLGIGMVHQHFMLAPVLTVTENIVMGAEPKKGIFFRHSAAINEVQELINKFNFKIDPTAKVGDLSVGEQQRVEILKAMYRKVDILILDEPTAVLTPQETDELFSILKDLKKSGMSIIIITHKLKETIAIADTISVLRRGKMIISAKELGEVNPNELATHMVGRKVSLGIKKRSESIGETVFSVRNLDYTRRGCSILKDIEFDVKKGEILGLVGVEGNGQTELIEILTGITKPDQMNLHVDGKEMHGDAKMFIDGGIGHIPEDRHERGAVNELSIRENAILGYHHKNTFCDKGILNSEVIDRYTEELVEDYDIRTHSIEAAMNTLSGGNQQKVIVARVFSQDQDVIIVAQPTRGVDVGAMEYIHNKMYEYRDRGKAILLISSDLDELRNLSDRLLVIYEGRIVAEGKTDEFTEMELGLLMNGEQINGQI